MQIVPNVFRGRDLPIGGVVTVGNYDGIHRGQRALLEQVRRRADELGTTSIVVTFDPHPLRILAPERAPAALLTRGQRDRELEALGIEALVVVPFTPELAAMPAERFVREVLVGRLRAREVHVGSRFAFGQGRLGNLALLEELGRKHGFVAHGVGELVFEGEVVSASRVRQAVAEGAVDRVWKLLGRPYSIEGRILRGDRMGKRLGWPTINLEPENELLPAEGVYVTQVHFPSFPATFDCVTNIGTRPTVYENYRKVVESHILDFSSDVYGERVALAFWRRLRDERIFPNVMELSKQIGRDVEETREYFAGYRRSLSRDGAPTPLAIPGVNT